MLGAILILAMVSVTDGDTIRSGDLRVRLWGIDAAEMNERGGKEARAALTSLINGQQLTCEVKDVDRYKRVVALCRLPDGRDIACEMVKLGQATDWAKYSGGYYRACVR